MPSASARSTLPLRARLAAASTASTGSNGMPSLRAKSFPRPPGKTASRPCAVAQLARDRADDPVAAHRGDDLARCRTPRAPARGRAASTSSRSTRNGRPWPRSAASTPGSRLQRAAAAGVRVDDQADGAVDHGPGGYPSREDERLPSESATKVGRGAAAASASLAGRRRRSAPAPSPGRRGGRRRRRCRAGRRRRAMRPGPRRSRRRGVHRRLRLADDHRGLAARRRSRSRPGRRPCPATGRRASGSSASRVAPISSAPRSTAWVATLSSSKHEVVVAGDDHDVGAGGERRVVDDAQAGVGDVVDQRLGADDVRGAAA